MIQNDYMHIRLARERQSTLVAHAQAAREARQARPALAEPAVSPVLRVVRAWRVRQERRRAVRAAQLTAAVVADDSGGSLLQVLR